METSHDYVTQQATLQADFKFRLDHILEILGFETDAAFARHLGVTPQVVHNWRQRLISTDARDLFEEKTGYSWRWVNYGRGNAAACDNVRRPFDQPEIKEWLSKSLFAVRSAPENQSTLSQVLQHFAGDRVKVVVFGCGGQKIAEITQCEPVAGCARDNEAP